MNLIQSPVMSDVKKNKIIKQEVGSFLVENMNIERGVSTINTELQTTNEKNSLFLKTNS